MGQLTRDSAKKARVKRIELTTGDEGDYAFIRKMPYSVIDGFIAKATGKESPAEERANIIELCLWSLCNEQGDRLFEPSKDEEEIGQMQFDMLLEIANAVMEFNGLKNPEAVEKNSEATPSA